MKNITIIVLSITTALGIFGILDANKNLYALESTMLETDSVESFQVNQFVYMTLDFNEFSRTYPNTVVSVSVGDFAGAKHFNYVKENVTVWSHFVVYKIEDDVAYCRPFGEFLINNNLRREINPELQKWKDNGGKVLLVKEHN